MNSIIDPVINDIYQMYGLDEKSVQEYLGLPDVEWQDVLNVIPDADLDDHFWASTGPDGFDGDNWRQDSTDFRKKALEFVALHNDAALGKMFRTQIQTYFAGIAQSHLEDIQQALGSA